VLDFWVIRKSLQANFWMAVMGGWLLEFPEFLHLLFVHSDLIEWSSDLALLDIFYGAQTSHLSWTTMAFTKN
jgi:hypothetical protein